MKFLHVACAALLALNAGCLKTVTIRTVIEDDGSAERYIKIESQGERAPSVDSDLRLPERKGWKLYKSNSSSFEARGKFKSVADIPADFRKGDRVTDGEGEEKRFVEKSRSVKTYKAFRCALFAVHDYTETITDCTSVDEFNKAVEKVIELRTLAYAIIEKAYGEEFDLTEAKAYVDKEIVPRVRRLAVMYWDARVDKRPGRDERFKQAVLKLLRELGVALPEDVDDRGPEDAFKKWVFEKFAQLIKRKEGKPLTAKELAERLASADDDDGETKLEKIAKEIVKKQYGSQEVFEAYLEGVGDKLFGAYFEILGHGFQFDATVVIPGQVVETNGFINKDEVRWSFDHNAIFPGYTMRVRSVAFARANDLGDGRSVITSPKRAVILAEFTEKQNENDRFRILTAIGEVARTRSPAALRRLAEGDNAVTGLERVLKKTGLSREE